MRTGRDLPFGWTSTPNFHPEFGYMCPSPRMRRGISVSVAIAALGIAVAFMTAARGFARDETDGQQVRLARSAIEESTIPVAAVLLMPAARTVGKGTSNPKRAEIDCKDVFGFHLGPVCAQRKSRTARINRMVMILIGSSAAPAAIWPAPATTAAEVNTANTSMSSTTQPTSPPTATPKVLTLARASMRKPSRKIAANTYGKANTYYAYAYAYAYPGTQTAQLSATSKVLTLTPAGTRKPSRKVDAFAATASWPQGDSVRRSSQLPPRSGGMRLRPPRS
jgi:hypothetical protein